MANDYTTSTDAFNDISEGNYSSSDYPQMGTFVTAASRLIDNEFGRWAGFFYPSTSDVDYYYDGNGETCLSIDEFASITSVAVSEVGGVESSDYTALSSSDFFTLPHNHAAKGKPINAIEIDGINGSGSIFAFYGYRKAVKVSGVAGYSVSPPDVIVQAVKRQAVRWFMQAKQGYQDTGASVSIGSITVNTSELDNEIKNMLKPLKLELM
jgi:hypothetical protein